MGSYLSWKATSRESQRWLPIAGYAAVSKVENCKGASTQYVDKYMYASNADPYSHGQTAGQMQTTHITIPPAAG